MDIVTLLPFIVLIGAMFLMTRSAKKKQQAAAQMRDQMQPGTGIRTIGGMYATVKEIHEDTVLLEVAPGVHALYAKNSVGAVLPDEEYNRIIDGAESASKTDQPVVPDDASALTEAPAAGAEDEAAKDVNVKDEERTEKGDASDKIVLGKDEAKDEAKEAKDEDAEPQDAKKDGGDSK